MPKRTTNKSAFIRSLGKIPAKEAVAKGKAAGLKFSENFVYTARANAKKAKGTTGRRGRRPIDPRGLHATLNRLSMDLADAIIKAVREAIRSTLG